MKSFISILVILCAIAAAGTILYLHRQKNLPPPAPVVETSAVQTIKQSPTEKIVTPQSDSPPIVSANTNTPAQISISTSSATETNSDDATNAIHKIVDALLTAKNGEEKHNLFQQLIKSGQLAAAIEDLKTRAAQNPNDPEIPTTLGEAQLNEIQAIKAAGGDIDQLGILAMQADQNFNAALKIDPQNWEAQFVKAASMYYWPVNPERDADTVQRLSNLIDQQETMTPNAAFAQTYLVLGNEYQKIGQPEKALATWQLGLMKFPGDATLQKKISGQ